jgi:hypothetical protein
VSVSLHTGYDMLSCSALGHMDFACVGVALTQLAPEDDPGAAAGDSVFVHQ